LRTALWQNAGYLKTGLQRLGIAVQDNYLPIAAFSRGSAEEMKNIRDTLLTKGIFIQMSKYVGADIDGVLRIVVFSSHTKDDIDRLLGELEKLLNN